MAQRPIEMILMRQLAGCISVPICVLDERGAVVYCNEPAEQLLGRPLEEIERLALPDRWALLHPTDETGAPLDPAALPESVAIRERRPLHRVIAITAPQGRTRRVAVTAFPVMRQNGHPLGAVSILWDA